MIIFGVFNDQLISNYLMSKFFERNVYYPLPMNVITGNGIETSHSSLFTYPLVKAGMWNNDLEFRFYSHTFYQSIKEASRVILCVI